MQLSELREQLSDLIADGVTLDTDTTPTKSQANRWLSRGQRLLVQKRGAGIPECHYKMERINDLTGYIQTAVDWDDGEGYDGINASVTISWDSGNANNQIPYIANNDFITITAPSATARDKGDGTEDNWVAKGGTLAICKISSLSDNGKTVTLTAYASATALDGTGSSTHDLAVGDLFTVTTLSSSRTPSVITAGQLSNGNGIDKIVELMCKNSEHTYEYEPVRIFTPTSMVNNDDIDDYGSETNEAESPVAQWIGSNLTIYPEPTSIKAITRYIPSDMSDDTDESLGARYDDIVVQYAVAQFYKQQEELQMYRSELSEFKMMMQELKDRRRHTYRRNYKRMYF